MPRSLLKEMKNGSVIVDVAIDQGGCVETAKPTTHEDPTYEVDGVVHYCVANMPGAVGRTSTFGLTNATLPYAIKLANQGAVAMAKADPGFALGINVMKGKVTYKPVADAFEIALHAPGGGPLRTPPRRDPRPERASAGVTAPQISSFRQVPRTGVIYVTAQAAAQGWRRGDPDWANLGQGSPETGPLAGAPERVEALELIKPDYSYGPVAGVLELRQAVADLYNELYRKGKRSQYTAENVAISGGGRVALTRAVAGLNSVNLGHFLPDYRLRGAALALPPLHADPDPAPGQPGLLCSRSRTSGARSWGAGWARS